jgi:hypothetical protein
MVNLIKNKNKILSSITSKSNAQKHIEKNKQKNLTQVDMPNLRANCEVNIYLYIKN